MGVLKQILLMYKLIMHIRHADQQKAKAKLTNWKMDHFLPTKFSIDLHKIEKSL